MLHVEYVRTIGFFVMAIILLFGFANAFYKHSSLKIKEREDDVRELESRLKDLRRHRQTEERYEFKSLESKLNSLRRENEKLLAQLSVLEDSESESESESE